MPNKCGVNVGKYRKCQGKMRGKGLVNDVERFWAEFLFAADWHGGKFFIVNEHYFRLKFDQKDQVLEFFFCQIACLKCKNILIVERTKCKM